MIAFIENIQVLLISEIILKVIWKYKIYNMNSLEMNYVIQIRIWFSSCKLANETAATISSLCQQFNLRWITSLIFWNWIKFPVNKIDKTGFSHCHWKVISKTIRLYLELSNIVMYFWKFWSLSFLFYDVVLYGYIVTALLWNIYIWLAKHLV